MRSICKSIESVCCSFYVLNYINISIHVHICFYDAFKYFLSNYVPDLASDMLKCSTCAYLTYNELTHMQELAQERSRLQTKTKDRKQDDC